MNYDVMIVGGGMVGATLALALARQTSLSILVLESQADFPVWDNTRYHHRVSAISLSSQRIFQSLEVWKAIRQRRVSPFQKIMVWDASAAGELTFAANEVAESVLGYIIENTVIQTALIEKLQTLPQVTWINAVNLTECHEEAEGIRLSSADGRVFSGKLAVAADGARSWLRQAAGIKVETHDYEQEALIATVRTSLPHAAIARQVFLTTGPLAFLPLAEAHTSSIVWSLPTGEAGRLRDLDPEAFCHELTVAFSQRLGAVLQVDGRYVLPLRSQKTKQYVAGRVVLVGDAAHTVHPLAGQGVNMGLLDAASLAEVLAAIAIKKRDIAAYIALRRYERWRKADNAMLLTGVDWIKAIFANEHKAMQTWRAFGVKATDKIAWIKNRFMRHAVGDRAGLPMIAAKRYTP